MPITNKNSLSKSTRTDFTQDYKMQVFTMWYNSGKPSPERFYSLLVEEDVKEPLSGEMPTKSTVTRWIKTDFEAKSTFLDTEAIKAIEKQLVGNKIQMLTAHAAIGRELSQMGMEFLRSEGLGNSRNALSAIIEGLRIETESSGASVKFNELSKMTDEELLGEFTKLVQGSKLVSVGPNDE